MIGPTSTTSTRGSPASTPISRASRRGASRATAAAPRPIGAHCDEVAAQGYREIEMLEQSELRSLRSF